MMEILVKIKKIAAFYTCFILSLSSAIGGESFKAWEASVDGTNVLFSHGGDFLYFSEWMAGKVPGYQLESGLPKGIQVTPLAIQTPEGWQACNTQDKASRGLTYMGRLPRRMSEEARHKKLSGILYGIIPLGHLQAAPNCYEASVPDEHRQYIAGYAAQIWVCAEPIPGEYKRNIEALKAVLERCYPDTNVVPSDHDLFCSQYIRRHTDEELAALLGFNNVSPLRLG